MTSSDEQCVFKRYLEDSVGGTEQIDAADFCNVTACTGVYEVAHSRLHGECVSKIKLKPVVGKEASRILFDEYEVDPDAPEPEPLLSSGEPEPRFLGANDGSISVQYKDIVGDELLGHIGRGAIDKPKLGRR